MTTVQFPVKFFFEPNGQFWPDCDPKYVSFYFKTCSKKFFQVLQSDRGQ